VGICNEHSEEMLYIYSTCMWITITIISEIDKGYIHMHFILNQCYISWDSNGSSNPMSPVIKLHVTPQLIMIRLQFTHTHNASFIVYIFNDFDHTIF
jgi:hypothetical protein